MSETRKYEENYGVVIFLDALGMKGVWQSKEPEIILAHWNVFVGATKDLLRDRESKKGIKYSVYAFSDTAIITIKNGTIENLIIEASDICATIVDYEMVRELYFRGCISVGKFYEHEDGTIVLGPAVDEAAQYYSLPNLVGVFAAPSAYSVLERMHEKIGDKLTGSFVQYDIPFKDRIYRKGWIVKLDLEIPDFHKSRFDNPAFTDFKNLKEIAHYNLEHLVNVDAAEKWKNTLEFMNFIKNTHTT